MVSGPKGNNESIMHHFNTSKVDHTKSLVNHGQIVCVTIHVFSINTPSFIYSPRPLVGRLESLYGPKTENGRKTWITYSTKN